jgi:hypothetical protein
MAVALYSAAKIVSWINKKIIHDVPSNLHQLFYFIYRRNFWELRIHYILLFNTEDILYKFGKRGQEFYNAKVKSITVEVIGNPEPH